MHIDLSELESAVVLALIAVMLLLLSNISCLLEAQLQVVVRTSALNCSHFFANMFTKLYWRRLRRGAPFETVLASAFATKLQLSGLAYSLEYCLGNLSGSYVLKR